MKRFFVREVETLKTTAAMYDCGCDGQPPCEITCYCSGSSCICGDV
jgi:hypothetical protein